MRVCLRVCASSSAWVCVYVGVCLYASCVCVCAQEENVMERSIKLIRPMAALLCIPEIPDLWEYVAEMTEKLDTAYDSKKELDIEIAKLIRWTKMAPRWPYDGPK